MEGSKKWYASKTVWASLILVVITVLRLLGKEEVAQTVEAESEGIAAWLVDAVTLALAAIAIYGRVVADKTLEG